MVAQLSSLGFDSQRVINVLRKVNGNLERAVQVGEAEEAEKRGKKVIEGIREQDRKKKIKGKIIGRKTSAEREGRSSRRAGKKKKIKVDCQIDTETD